MNSHATQGLNQISAPRSSNGCWTCRLRRKKCDERRPMCDVCATLHITCNYDLEKPAWMDGGVKQQEMSERIKREVKENAHLRRIERPSHSFPSNRVSPSPQRLDGSLVVQATEAPNVTEAVSRWTKPFGQPDAMLTTFYLERLLPFLFPFYRPSLLEGGKAWMLEMIVNRPVVRQTVLCQSSYFFSLIREASQSCVIWEPVIAQTREAFDVLRQALQVIQNSNIKDNLQGAVRILTSILQLQRFEIALSSFGSCQVHLNAALELFRQLLDSVGAVELDGGSVASFNAVMSGLASVKQPLPVECAGIPNAEQAAFRFSSALLIYDDIIASTVLQEQPMLIPCHRSFLGGTDVGKKPLIDLETVVGCQNWVLVQIADIAVLDAWKQRCKRAGDLDVMRLVHRATSIKNTLESNLHRIETEATTYPSGDGDISLEDILAGTNAQRRGMPAEQSILVTRAWAHAALVYLSVVVSGFQPTSADVRHHVGQVFDLLTYQISPPALLRTMVWPFCVAGCLAEPGQEPHLRKMVEQLQPPSVFGTLRKALEIMETAWRDRSVGDAANRDLATCFRSQDDLVLLV